MSPEQKLEIEKNRNVPTRGACAFLNNILKENGGPAVSDCFCSNTARRAFLKTFNQWYDNYQTING